MASPSPHPTPEDLTALLSLFAEALLRQGRPVSAPEPSAPPSRPANRTTPQP